MNRESYLKTPSRNTKNVSPKRGAGKNERKNGGPHHKIGWDTPWVVGAGPQIRRVIKFQCHDPGQQRTRPERGGDAVGTDAYVLGTSLGIACVTHRSAGGIG